MVGEQVQGPASNFDSQRAKKEAMEQNFNLMSKSCGHRATFQFSEQIYLRWSNFLSQ